MCVMHKVPAKPEVPVLRPLTTKTVQSTSLSLQSIYNIQTGNGLSLGVFGVGDCIADDGFKEGFENATGFFVDHWWRRLEKNIK